MPGLAASSDLGYRWSRPPFSPSSECPRFCWAAERPPLRLGQPARHQPPCRLLWPARSTGALSPKEGSPPLFCPPPRRLARPGCTALPGRCSRHGPATRPGIRSSPRQPPPHLPPARLTTSGWLRWARRCREATLTALPTCSRGRECSGRTKALTTTSRPRARTSTGVRRRPATPR